MSFLKDLGYSAEEEALINWPYIESEATNFASTAPNTEVGEIRYQQRKMRLAIEAAGFARDQIMLSPLDELAEARETKPEPEDLLPSA